jgi:hypothetical protein
MSPAIYLISAVLVFVFSGLLAMAGLGAAFLFVPLFYYLGVPLAEATPTALLLNDQLLAWKTDQLAGRSASADRGSDLIPHWRAPYPICG